jgi:predicted permease
MALSMNVEVLGYTPRRRGDDIADFNFISPFYFGTMGQPLLLGRDFTEHDDRNNARVAIVNERFVRHFFSGRDPVGRRFRQGGSEIEIVGVVGDARDRDTRKGPEEAVYIPEKQGQTSGLTVLVRTAHDANQLIPSLLAIVRSVDKRLPVVSVRRLDLQIEAGFSSERILGYLSSLFGALAMLLAGVGLYGVISYSVTSRTREIGVRFAVGAQSVSIVILFAREIAIMLLAGLIVGIPFALASGNALKSLLFGLRATDPFTLFASVLALGFVAVLAVAVPLWRAAIMNPLTALRHE